MIRSTLYFSLLVLSCCLFLLLKPNEANQEEQLRKLIKSQSSASSSNTESDSWFDSFSAEPFSPAFVGLQDGLKEADKIGELPGQPKGVDFDQYAGYVTVDPKNGRALFYYFVESPKDSSSKPLVLWLNGGPGCSSLGYGAMEELGPFKVNSDGRTLRRNYYAWNNVANVIFLESPAGVGFSYSKTTSDYEKSGDKRTAEDSYTFLLNWLERFPEYKTREFFITGESYAGHYVPQLAQTILQNNKITNQTVINLQGIAVGNGYVDRVGNTVGGLEFQWSHALISDDTHAKILANCNFSAPLLSSECGIAMSSAAEETGNIDRYNIYAPLCQGSNTPTGSGVAMAEFDPCSDSYIYYYLNLPAVQKALHANVTALPYPWQGCSEVISYVDSVDTMLPTIKSIISGGISVWLYSGDLDTVCSISSTRYFIKLLSLPVKSRWRPWYLNNEVGGYVEEYNGLTLATVRGAGHLVPSNQPERALTMISSFLEGKLPPSS